MPAVTLVFVIVLFVGAVGCKTEPKQHSTAPVAAPSTAVPSAVPAPSGTGAPSITGVLDEESFKKLHELKTVAAPPRRGVDVSVAGSTAYLSLPKQASALLPGLVVIHEWWGLNPHIMHWADRLAEDGYAALAVDLYEGKVANNPTDAMAYMKAVDPKKALATLKAGHAFLVSDSRIKARRSAVIGWCFGGKWSLELGLAEPELDAVVVYYGHVPTELERLRSLKAPLLGIFANRDQAIPPAHVDAFEKALKQVGARTEIRRYDADHAFANPSGARYDYKSAEDAFKHVRAFLAKHLKQDG